jgi:hypothetical protein
MHAFKYALNMGYASIIYTMLVLLDVPSKMETPGRDNPVGRPHGQG